MVEKEPTQRTIPPSEKDPKAEPMDIPIPTRGQIDDALAQVAKPQVSRKRKRRASK